MSSESDASEISSCGFDVERLIKLVQPRPVIWEVTCAFKDRNEKKVAWQEVLKELNEYYDTFPDTQKRLFEKTVQSRWKNVKDTYRKYKNSLVTKSGGRHKKRKKYVYEKLLRFLDDNKAPPPIASFPVPSTYPQVTLELPTIKTEPPDPEEDINEDETVDEEPGPSNPKKKKQSTVEETFINYLQMQTNKKPQEEPDEHQSFFDSMLSTVRGFNDDETLEFRSAVIDIAQSIRLKQRKS